MSATRILTVELPEGLVRMIEGKVAAGEYGSESDVVREGLEALQADAGQHDMWLRREALPVYESVSRDPARLAPASRVFGRLEAKYRQDMDALRHEP